MILLLILAVLLLPLQGYSATYHVSNSGDDTNDGLSEETPWRTLERVGCVARHVKGRSDAKIGEVAGQNYYDPGTEYVQAQTFKAKRPCKSRRIGLWLSHRVGQPTGKLNVTIETVIDGKPSGVLLTPGSSSSQNLDYIEKYSWSFLCLEDYAYFLPDTEYAIVSRMDDQLNGTTNQIGWRYARDGGEYPDGMRLEKVGDGDWVERPNDDFVFVIIADNFTPRDFIRLDSASMWRETLYLGSDGGENSNPVTYGFYGPDGTVPTINRFNPVEGEWIDTDVPGEYRIYKEWWWPAVKDMLDSGQLLGIGSAGSLKPWQFSCTGGWIYYRPEDGQLPKRILEAKDYYEPYGIVAVKQKNIVIDGINFVGPSVNLVDTNGRWHRAGEGCDNVTVRNCNMAVAGLYGNLSYIGDAGTVRFLNCTLNTFRQGIVHTNESEIGHLIVSGCGFSNKQFKVIDWWGNEAMVACNVAVGQVDVENCIFDVGRNCESVIHFGGSSTGPNKNANVRNCYFYADQPIDLSTAPTARLNCVLYEWGPVGGECSGNKAEKIVVLNGRSYGIRSYSQPRELGRYAEDLYIHDNEFKNLDIGIGVWGDRIRVEDNTMVNCEQPYIVRGTNDLTFRGNKTRLTRFRHITWSPNMDNPTVRDNCYEPSDLSYYMDGVGEITRFDEYLAAAQAINPEFEAGSSVCERLPEMGPINVRIRVD